MDIVKFFIDGQEVEAERGENLIQVAKRNGISIPSLCYYPHIDLPLATCRVCSVGVNGKEQAACLVKAKEGMQIAVNTPELNENRKAVTEMIFAEGNHFCPSCEKSGDCDLQHLAYKSGIRHSRFPHLFQDRVIDFHPKRMILEHNRCILCRRCIEEVHTDDGHRVFTSSGRGHETTIAVDYEQEAKLSRAQAVRAMHICPVGAIIVRGENMSRPFGDRRYDDGTIDIPKQEHQRKILPREGKKVVATTSLAGCFGCHMSMLDIDLELLDIIELVDFDKSPLNDIKDFSQKVDIGLIEGGCCNSDNIEVLREFRKKCDLLVAVGECAIYGGVPALRNTVPLEECLEEAYIHSMSSEADAQVIPASEDLPKILDKVCSCHELVRIDYFIPGCPPSANHIWRIVKNLLFNEDYSILYSDFKYD